MFDLAEELFHVAYEARFLSRRRFRQGYVVGFFE